VSTGAADSFDTATSVVSESVPPSRSTSKYGTRSVAAGDGESAWLAKEPPAETLTVCLPVAVPQALFFAVIVFSPSVSQTRVIVLVVELPAAPSVVQSHPLADGVQLVALAEKLSDCPMPPVCGPLTETTGWAPETVTVRVVEAVQIPKGHSCPGLLTSSVTANVPALAKVCDVVGVPEETGAEPSPKVQ
jgi:hypothetical protein